MVGVVGDDEEKGTLPGVPPRELQDVWSRTR